ncbi:MAG: phosphatase PAP2 family protein [Nitrospinota bacterium]|nr:MAG: phosphatase PAP2 family protein [Nitrospinota bacterium]
MEQRIVDFLLPYMHQWGYYLLFVMTFLETSAFVGLLVPGEGLVVMAGFFASHRALDLGDVIWVASVGAILGDTVGYWIGYRFGEKFFRRYGRYLFFKPEYLEEAQRFFVRHGGKTVFVGRFLSWLRAFAPVVAGLSHMPYPRFLLANLLGGVAWAITFALAGYFVGNSWDLIRGYLGRLGLFAFIGGGLGLYLVWLVQKKRHMLQEKLGWIEQILSTHMPHTWTFFQTRLRAGRWYGRHFTLALLSLLLSLLALGEIIEDVIDRETLYRLDFQIQRVVESVISPGMTRIMVEITTVGGIYLLLLTLCLLVIVLLRRRAWWDVYALSLAAGGGEVVLQALKFGFHRPRPQPQLVPALGYSFPSGHAFAATVVYGFLVYLVWKYVQAPVIRYATLLLAFLIILIVGVSRIYLNVHWLTDVLAGYTAGLAWLVLSIVLVHTMHGMVHDTQGERE